MPDERKRRKYTEHMAIAGMQHVVKTAHDGN
jgi:hypothetical protein